MCTNFKYKYNRAGFQRKTNKKQVLPRISSTHTKDSGRTGFFQPHSLPHHLVSNRNLTRYCGPDTCAPADSVLEFGS